MPASASVKQEFRREQEISVSGLSTSLALEQSVYGIGQIAGDLIHPQPIRCWEIPAIWMRRVEISKKNRTM